MYYHINSMIYDNYDTTQLLLSFINRVKYIVLYSTCTIHIIILCYHDQPYCSVMAQTLAHHSLTGWSHCALFP